MRFLQRLTANTITVYLILYLVDSVTGGRFLVGNVWVAVFLALVLGLINSLIKPLKRVRTRTGRALVVSLLTLLVNALFVQIFVWSTPLYSVNLSWTLLVAAFVAVVTGAIDWLIGFGPSPKARPGETPPARREVRKTQPRNTTRDSQGARKKRKKTRPRRD